MMQCGHAANAISSDGTPVCAICINNPGARTIDTTRNLTDRTAICSYTWRTDGAHTPADNRRVREHGYQYTDGPVPSSSSLPFFQHRPGEVRDLYYCGCFGWD
jgi:hypothetical protein